VAVRGLEVHTPSAVAPVDLSLALARRIGPVSQFALVDALHDGVEFGLAHQEGVMLPRDRPLLVGEIEGHAVRHVEHIEMRKLPRHG
jgi:hypothetical protein